MNKINIPSKKEINVRIKYYLWLKVNIKYLMDQKVLFMVLNVRIFKIDKLNISSVVCSKQMEKLLKPLYSKFN